MYIKLFLFKKKYTFLKIVFKHMLISITFPNVNKGNNKITELRTILQRESQNS